ncbi:hypothetical protein [Lacticaseibacillus nasuensis]|nr:hypothetical protein [Lacticaseibacillus nasuensis]
MLATAASYTEDHLVTEAHNPRFTAQAAPLRHSLTAVAHDLL